ncbi:MAG: hypothetical protein AAF585_28040 [Verrucomicrobiota bacterium]
MSNQEKKNDAPVAHLRQGNLEAAIWSNSGTKGNFYSATFSRKYQAPGENGQMEWKQTNSFRARDLPNLAKLANDTHTRVQELSRTQEQQRTLKRSI